MFVLGVGGDSHGAWDITRLWCDGRCSVDRMLPTGDEGRVPLTNGANTVNCTESAVTMGRMRRLPDHIIHEETLSCKRYAAQVLRPYR